MADEKEQPSRAKPSSWGYVLASVAITAVITAILSVLSATTGGFAAYSQASGESAATVSLTVPIAIHLSTVLPCLVIGGVLLVRKKGDLLHKWLGRIYAVLMVITAIASFWIGRPGTGIAGSGYSFIHFFSVLTLVSIPWAVYAARTGRIASHQGTMRGLYIGLIVAGLFTLIPGRFLGNLLF
ncbi:DUF2306 domain-containing protein [Altererythrobacter sp. RZ02]|uniref:DUF2306 domain-containing protein n=1 Tax=Pontixanthobacter rizhaonensis TaxID=2730337 RepID=A0A848QH03_9SPHN|nr:DUF2306 domain-containing protein [Pontixanthobacter rizhaonensis]NMW32941.1 DUF2306 domain-containing protein [Pontixanthobacter rizhaonensis]